jgi:hypothetical protein
MLEAAVSLLKRTAGAAKTALPLALIPLALASMGCASLVGEQTAETKFLVKPKSDTTFWGWSEITIEEDASSVNRATLKAVTVEPMEGSAATDMSFLQTVAGEAVTSKERKKLVEEAKVPADERLVALDVLYKDDLRPFFEDGHTVRVEWLGQTNPAYAWPEEGVWIKVRIVVEIE